MALRSEECRLAPPELVASFNDVAGILQDVATRLPRFARSDRFAKIADQLRHFEKLLRKDHYTVGFLGVSQVGKSSTLNYALDGSIVPIGKSAPCTSTIIRVRFVPLNQPAKLILNYMTPEQYQSRRATAAELALGKSDIGPDEDELSLIAHVEKLLESTPESDFGTPKESRGYDAKRNDRQYFLRLLRSHQQHGQTYVKSPAHIPVEEFASSAEFGERLRKIARHDETSDGGSPHLLLHQIELAVPTDSMSPDMELVDMPGLGAESRRDDRLTESFLGELDGALIFQSSENVRTHAVNFLVDCLSKNFGTLPGRVWVVVTKFDMLQPHSIDGGGDGRTMLDTIAEMLSAYRLGLSQGILVSNEFHRQWCENGRNALPEMYKYTLKLQVDDQGQPVFPEAVKRQPVLLEAYREVTKDGGISKLRDVIKHEVPENVKQRVARDINAGLRELCVRLSDQLELAKAQKGLTTEDWTAVEATRQRVAWLCERLDFAREVLDAPEQDLMAALDRVLDQVCPLDLLPQRDRIPEHFASISRMLKQQGIDHAFADNGTVAKVYDAISAELMAKLTVNPDSYRRLSNLKGVVDPKVELDATRDSDRRNRRWLEFDFASFEQPSLFAEDVTDVSPSDYRSLLECKIEVLASQVVQRIVNRVRCRLEYMDDRLKEIAQPNDEADAAEEAVYDEILRRLADLSPRFRGNYPSR